MQQDPYDIFIIGGGINGCGIARDASGRGYKVGLVEKRDLAAATSSASTKLIHGGLRYLEHYAFSLLREALSEREVILHNAPHLVRPARFLLPYAEEKRPFWLLRLGLFLYDHLGKRKEFLSTRIINFQRHYRYILKSCYRRGFEYSDAIVDDSRLVVANARHAAQLGADILVGWALVNAQKQEHLWKLTLKNEAGETKEIFASYVVNAAGPFIGEVLHGAFQLTKPVPMRLVKGSHIVVPALYAHDRAYIFQNNDKRIIFTIPYQDEFTLIGTTDIEYQGSLAQIEITSEEISYLCSAVNEYFEKQIHKEDVIWSYAGVRPLYDSGADKAQDVTRDYVLEESKDKSLPYLTIYGGKITAYRKLSEDVMHIIDAAFHKTTQNWTATIPLPGGDFSYKNLSNLEKRLKNIRPEFSNKTIKRLIGAYGREAFQIFAAHQDKGQNFGHEFYEIELLWMVKQEWARNLEDILWRRSKLGLYLTKDEQGELQAFLNRYFAQNRPNKL